MATCVTAADVSNLAEASKDAEEIIHQVKRMTQMCREVLDFARPKPPTRDLVDVVQVVDGPRREQLAQCRGQRVRARLQAPALHRSRVARIARPRTDFASMRTATAASRTRLRLRLP